MSSTNTTGTAKHKAGAFDIRNIIGLLLAIYGVILLLMGLFGDQARDRTGGVNANLWAGIVLLVVGGLFMLWARLKPILVPEHVEHDGDDADGHGHQTHGGGRPAH
ncbi:hypothetical protein MM440_02245 [Arsenicicoccus piscis]|uniref:Uncharacterized protein n=1 Tax=Arsenicicoccus piscis TaxID=673954 RepID=A0ABQ6HSS1_9MICO|nr:hypothetical protein [Arsenicicoccus piscis]MCH8626632.1 hypothetical protein [Arsenicicoccus piscis]GMA21290.1 hypothetical protein GCM10025862_33110 [Arsenicicoccus piscis]